MLEKLKSKKLLPSNIIIFILTCLLCFLIYESIVLSSQNQRLKLDYASINHVEYGMLSIQEWKEQLANILVKKIDAFEFDENNKVQIRRMIVQGLHSAFDQVERHLDRQTNTGGAINVLVKKSLRKFIEGIYTDIDDFREQIPQFANSIMSDLDNDENQQDIKAFLKLKLMEFLDNTIKDENYQNLNRIVDKYQTSSRAACSSKLETNILSNNQFIKFRLSIAIALFILMGILCFKFQHIYNKVLYVFVSFLFLLGGVTLPMLDIDARIEKFYFLLMGEPLEFSNQILFFQTKSILDVVYLLINNGAFDSVLVGFMIMLFSIIFPISKIITSCWYMANPKIAEHRIFNFLIFKSAKWSMADVFVVAIFMAYIGFNSILQNQMMQINRLEEKLEVLTMQYTSFQMGFLLFILFTISSLFMSSLLKQEMETHIKD